MEPNHWKKHFNSVGVIPSSDKYSADVCVHSDIVFEFDSCLSL